MEQILHVLGFCHDSGIHFDFLDIYLNTQPQISYILREIILFKNRIFGEFV